MLEEGKDIVNLLWELIKYIKDILVYKASNNLELYSKDEIEDIKKLCDKISKERLIDLVYELSELENSIKWSTQKAIMFQAGIIKLCNKKAEVSGNIEERVEKIEKYLRSGKGIVSQNSNVNYVQNAPINSTVNNTVNQTRKASQGTSNAVQKPKITQKFSTKSEEYWPQIVSNLKQNGKIVLYTNLINTKAVELNDMTVGIEFPRGMTPFGRTVLEKQENIREISNLVSMACGKEMQIKYITQEQPINKPNNEDDLKNLANESDIPFNIIE